MTRHPSTSRMTTRRRFLRTAALAGGAVPALAFFIAVQRYLVTGWGTGGVKG